MIILLLFLHMGLTISFSPCNVYDPDSLFKTFTSSMDIIYEKQRTSVSERALAGAMDLLKHVQDECQNKTYIFNPLTRFLLVKFLAVDIPKYLPEKETFPFLFPSISDLHYAATNLSYISKIYNLNASSLASGVLIGNGLGLHMTADDCMEMAHQLNFGEDNDKAREWLHEAEIRNFDSNEQLASQINKFKLHYEYEDHLLLMNNQFPAFCRGDIKPEPTKFHCYFDFSQYFFPNKVEVVSRSPSIMLFHDVLGPKRRQNLINIANGKLFRGPVALANGGRAETEHRVARIATIEEVVDETIDHSARVTKQATGFTLSREMIVVKYDVGGKFDLHYDFAMEYAHDIYSHLGISYAEALTYLVDTEYGGELIFPAVPAVIKPSAGSMVVWRDTDEEGLNDFSTLHGACPVVMGEKWITVRNFRATGQEGSCMADLDSHSNDKIKILKPEYSALHAELEFESFKESEEFFNFESRDDVEMGPSDIRY